MDPENKASPSGAGSQSKPTTRHIWNFTSPGVLPIMKLNRKTERQEPLISFDFVTPVARDTYLPVL